MLTYGSLFAGIGGIDLGLDRVGMQCAWQVEIDPYCRVILEQHWPGVPKFADIRECGAHNLSPVDVICGGFPCQNISNLGDREGLAGEKSGLWKEYARVISELTPRYVLIENVPAIAHRGLGTVLQDLATSGYDAEWQTLPAAAFGAPHRRERLYIIAYPRGLGLQLPHPHWPVEQATYEHWHLRRGSTGDVLEAIEQRLGEPAIFSRNDGVSPRLVRCAQLRVIGNAVVPQVAEWLGRQIIASEGTPYVPTE